MNIIFRLHIWLDSRYNALWADSVKKGAKRSQTITIELLAFESEITVLMSFEFANKVKKVEDSKGKLWDGQKNDG